MNGLTPGVSRRAPVSASRDGGTQAPTSSGERTGTSLPGPGREPLIPPTYSLTGFIGLIREEYGDTAADLEADYLLNVAGRA